MVINLWGLYCLCIFNNIVITIRKEPQFYSAERNSLSRLPDIEVFFLPPPFLPSYPIIILMFIYLHSPNYTFLTYLFYIDGFLALGFKPQTTMPSWFILWLIKFPAFTGSRTLTSNMLTTCICDIPLNSSCLNSLPAFVSSDLSNPIITYDMLWTCNSLFVLW